MTTPQLIIIMGVSGSGKSTLAVKLANALGYNFVEADDHHSAANKAHMAAGKPLTDAMREPWIEQLIKHIRQHHQQQQSVVLAYSGLRQQHRAKFRQAFPQLNCLFLEVAKGQLIERMNQRNAHFMPASLLDSQFEALEPFAAEEKITLLDGAKTPDALLKEVLK
ncbi:AAA family ATPase [Neiella sp. HB171785]|uniref:Gluconokinase n=1 Tax=Neiella litorisoli TaxID=2771431 RepID=A0A8J6UDZ6_9GAMM|nr:gluconokinase, GntK/IdnK-type [Neiella litorisoli]MBD1388919.1 AAA family ATPase [Neiella litorisoli]